MTQSRKEILGRLRQHAHPTPMPQHWKSDRDYADLADQFERALTAAKGEVHRVASWDAAVAQLETVLNQLEASKIAVNAEPVLDALNLPSRFADRAWCTVADVDQGTLRQFCVTADVGISSGRAALAETGSVILDTGAGRSRLVTLLPPVHVAIVSAEALTTDLFTWTASRQGAWEANTVLVSGPSKTADIEQTMAIGVHGPKQFIVILVEDSAQ